MADEDKPVGTDKPRSNIYTIMLLVTMAAYIAGLSLLIMEMQDTANFRHQLMGDKQYPTASSQKPSPAVKSPAPKSPAPKSPAPEEPASEEPAPKD